MKTCFVLNHMLYFIPTGYFFVKAKQIFGPNLTSRPPKLVVGWLKINMRKSEASREGAPLSYS